MPSLQQIAALAAASALLIVVPGPSVLFIIGRALTQGRRVALGGVLGNAIGCAAAAALVAAGLGVLLSRFEWLLLVMKLVGGAYLIWLGVRAYRRAGRDAAEVPAVAVPVTSWQSIRSGAFVGMTNPKSYLIFAAVVPQFAAPAAGPLPVQLLLLSLVPIGIGLVTDSVWALGAGRARQALSGPRAQRRAGRAGALCLVGLGSYVAVAPAGH
ncbi:LysE family translocator [Amnibacterium endophyticum]|uniref:LysE family translocator n=1 Tax=Amnibacterium endophyticum TaxID=2109337 RepID=A0ABW4LGD7_9MICO